MPKIRDLGISHIPATMRPVEIGDGGGGSGGGSGSGGGGACKDHEPTDKPDDGCGEPTDRDDCGEPTDRDGCKEPTTRHPGDTEPTTHPACGGGKRETASLSGAAIDALKQQLQQQINPEVRS